MARLNDLPFNWLVEQAGGWWWWPEGASDVSFQAVSGDEVFTFACLQGFSGVGAMLITA